MRALSDRVVAQPDIRGKSSSAMSLQYVLVCFMFSSQNVRVLAEARFGADSQEPIVGSFHVILIGIANASIRPAEESPHIIGSSGFVR